jgi:hypothetical protein
MAGRNTLKYVILNERSDVKNLLRTSPKRGKVAL